MVALKKEELERLEQEYGLEADGLTYQQRCSRITAVQKGEEWTKPEKKQRQSAPSVNDIRTSSLFGKKILIAPMMTPDAKRNLAFDEVLGDDMIVREVNAGEMIYGIADDNLDRMVGDYEIVRRDTTKKVVAKTTFPKIGQEISYTIGKDLVPVVRGNDGQSGYIWNFPTKYAKIGDTVIQMFGLKTLIQSVYPELLPKFSGKPVMSYIDGFTLVASIPHTQAILKEQQRKELLNARAGLE